MTLIPSESYPIMESLWDLIDWRADATPEGALAYDEADRSITSGAYREAVLRTAAGLWDQGVRPGDTVSWILPTWIEATIVTGALDRLGTRQNPVLPIYRDREVGFIARQLQPHHFITTPL